MILEHQITIDSPEVLSEALNYTSLKPGTDWAEGHHFTIANIEGKVIITVTGYNQQNEFIKVAFDAVEKKILNKGGDE